MICQTVRMPLRALSLTTVISLLLALPVTGSSSGFPGIGRTVKGFGYYNIDPGYDSKFRVYGTVDIFADNYDSGNHSGTRIEGGAAWTNKIGMYWRHAIGEDTVLEAILEEGFNLNGKALDQHWRQIGALRFAALTLRSKHWGKLDYGKTSGVGTPAYVDPYYAVYGSPYTFLTLVPSGPGWHSLDVRPKHTLVYTTPIVNGFKVATAASFGFDRAASINDGRTLRGKGISLNYSNPQFMAMASYNDYLSNPWNNGGKFIQSHNIYKSASVFYDFGPFSSNITWQRQEVRFDATPTVDNWTLGILLPVGDKHLARMLVTHRNVDAPQRGATGVSLGYDHFLQHNMALYARVGMIRNQRQSAISYAGLPVNLGDDLNSIAVGMYWHFGIAR